MADTGSDSLPRLADALYEVGDRLRQISDELRDLRGLQPPQAATETPTTAPPWAGHVPPTTATPVPATPVQTTPPPPAPDLPLPWYPPPTQYTEPAPPSLWERLSRDGAGSKILAWAGGVVTLAGVVLLLVLAIQRGYLGPLPRVLLGAGLGFVLAGIGMGLHRNPNARTGAYALAATGIAVLYLDVISATTLYHFLPPYAGLLTGLAVAGLGIALAGRWDSQPLAVFVVVCCAVSAPILTGGFVPLLLGFLLVLTIATTPVAFGKRWDWLNLAAGMPPVLACLINIGLATGDNRYDADSVTTALMCVVTSTVIIAMATIGAIRRPDDDIPLALVLVGPAPAMLAAVLLPRAGAAALPATVGVLLIVVWALRRPLSLPNRFAMSAGGAGSLAALQATATALHGDALPIAILGEALLLIMVAVWARYPAALVPASVFGVIGLVLTLAIAVPPRMLGTAPVGQVPPGTIVTAASTGLLLAVAAIAMCWAVVRFELLPAEDHVPFGWVAAGLVALYGASATMLSAGFAISPDRTGFLIGHVLVTVSWTVGALIALLRGIDLVPLRVAGLALVAAALAKLVLFDLSSLDGIARVAAFLVAGLVLLAAGARYAKVVATKART